MASVAALTGNAYWLVSNMDVWLRRRTLTDDGVPSENINCQIRERYPLSTVTKCGIMWTE